MLTFQQPFKEEALLGCNCLKVTIVLVPVAKFLPQNLILSWGLLSVKSPIRVLWIAHKNVTGAGTMAVSICSYVYVCIYLFNHYTSSTLCLERHKSLYITCLTSYKSCNIYGMSHRN